MPHVAPATPARLRAVSLLSNVLYLGLVISALAFVDGYLSAVVNFPSGAGALLGFFVIFLAVMLYLVWVFISWMQALIGRPGRLTLDRAGRQMSGWMVVAIVCYGLLTLGAIGQVFQKLGGAASTSWLTVVVTLLTYICCLVAVVAVRTWFSRGYVVGPVVQRQPLLWGIWGSNALTVVFVIDRVLRATAHPDSQRGVTLATTLVSSVLTLVVVGLIGHLIQLTFGVTDVSETPGAEASLYTP